MKKTLFVLIIFCSVGCKQGQQKNLQLHTTLQPVSIPAIPYATIKSSIAAKRKLYAAKYQALSMFDKKENLDEINNYWVNSIGNDLYNKWQGTAWDYNGTTTEPQKGAIACGYFVTTILKDMGLNISRQKLAVCPSSQMMRSLAPKQRLKNLAYLDYNDFCRSLNEFGKGVYIIGLDYHTGIIVNDGKQCWFIHSNYIRRQGVMKEAIEHCSALQSSRTRWLISLTNDKDFLFRWLHGQQLLRMHE